MCFVQGYSSKRAIEGDSGADLVDGACTALKALTESCKVDMQRCMKRSSSVLLLNGQGFEVSFHTSK